VIAFRRGIGGGFALAVLDLLEDLAHARAHQVPLLGVGFAIAPADPLGFARIEIIVGIHAPIVGDARRRRQPWSKPSCDPSPMQALIFDLDGTLVDTVYAHVFAWQRALLELGIPVDGWRIHRRIGMSGGLFTRAVAREIGRELTADEADVLQRRHGEVFREILPERRPLPGAIELLASLRRGGVTHGIATSGRRPEIDKSLEALGIPPETVVVERGDVLRAKPEPDLFLACQERIGVAVRDCYVVGDAVWDLLAARRAGMLSVGLLTGGYGEDELRAAGAFRVYRDAAELHESLDELGIALGPA
jgi:HAD superfamily hydrolase (TIGR01549 family)